MPRSSDPEQTESSPRRATRGAGGVARGAERHERTAHEAQEARHVEVAADVPPPAVEPMSAAELAGTLDAVADPLYVVDRYWRLRYLNRAASDACRTPCDEAVGQVLWQVHPPLAASELHDRLTAAMRDRRAVQAETFWPAGGGWLSVSAYPTADGLLVLQHEGDESHAADDPRHLLEAERAARTDAERQREQAERLAIELEAARDTADGMRRAAERARRDAEAAARAKSDFLATMSHELRTPINAITGYTQLLELGVAGPLTDSQRSYLARLYASGRHLLGLVDDVLDLANIERGRMSITRDRLATSAVVAAALALITPEAAARSIRLVDEREGDSGLHFVGDEHRVRQILLNLLSNAVKFTPPGGTVAVGCDRIVRDVADASAAVDDAVSPGEWVCISVRDTGIGIPAEQRAAIFEPFMQGDSSRTRTAGGTGLGLALSRRLARLMGGDLRVESEVGRGSTFTLLLPAAATAGVAPPTAAPAVGGVWTSPALAEFGGRMRERIESLIDAFVARLRGDPTFGSARTLSRSQLEDHTLSMLGAVVQALAAIEESGGLEGELLRDGSAIQEHIAFQHGEQRFRLGWSESMLGREYAILTEEVLTLARRLDPTGAAAARRARDVLAHLLDRAREVSVRGFQHAKRFNSSV